MSKVLKAYKTEITPNNVQLTKLQQHVGCARFAFNWALAKKKKARRNKVFIS